MFRLLRQRNFALLWWSGLISFAGDWMMMIARPLYVYEMTGSALATSLMFIAGTLPRIALGSVAGVFVDRWDRQRTMVVANLLLALAILPLLLVRSAEHLWLVYLSAFCTATLSQFLYPAENAFLPTLVEDGDLVSANALNNMNNQIARLTGPAIGGILMASFGFSMIVLADVLTFALAGLMIAAIRLPRSAAAEAAPPAEKPALSARHVFNEWREGLAIVRQSYTLTIMFILMAITSIGEGVLSVLLAPFATDLLQTDAVGLGGLMSAQAVGGIIGGAIIARRGGRGSLWAMAGWGSLLVGLFDLVLLNYYLFIPGVAFGMVVLVITGLPVAALMTGVLTLLQKGADDTYRGRVFGALMTVSSLFALIGIILAGTLGEIFGPALINVQVVAYVLGGVLVLVAHRRKVSRVPGPALDPVAGEL
ncbi:MFS transporter [Anaerolineae bacterium CFX9]|nr:MFS transporter [Anaerolineae bacterium CFX9]